jgi:hypothetical protein
VKRSGRDESVRVVIHLCMETILGISLYSYPYLNQQKCFVFLITSCIFSPTKLEERAEQVLPGSKGHWLGGGGGEQREGMTQTMCAHMNISIKKKKFAFPTDTASAQAVSVDRTQ